MDFIEDKFMSYVDNVFIKILHAIMLKKLDTVKHFISDDLYSNLNNIIENLNNNNLIQMYEMTNVKESKIIEKSETQDKYIIKVYLVSRYVDYQIDKDSKKIISGNYKRIEKENILTFEKNKNTKDQSISRKCPNCGANMDIMNSGKCEYCGSIYDLENYDYILTSID